MSVVKQLKEFNGMRKRLLVSTESIYCRCVCILFSLVVLLLIFYSYFHLFYYFNWCLFFVFILEHDKERGTRQKIDEPPTPYRYYTYDGKNFFLCIDGSQKFLFFSFQVTPIFLVPNILNLNFSAIFIFYF